MGLIKTGSKPDLAPGLTLLPLQHGTFHTNVSLGTHSSGCCHRPFTSDHSFPNLGEGAEIHVIRSCPRRPGLLLSSGSEWSWGSHLTPQQPVGSNRSLGYWRWGEGAQGLAPACLSHLNPLHSPTPFPLSLGTCIYGCMHSHVQLFWDPMEFLAVLQTCQTCFCLKDFYLLSLCKSLFPETDKWIIHIV